MKSFQFSFYSSKNPILKERLAELVSEEQLLLNLQRELCKEMARVKQDEIGLRNQLEKYKKEIEIEDRNGLSGNK